MTIFQVSAPVSLIVGPPIGSLLLQLDKWIGLHGWQWLFVVEALPAIIMSVIMWTLLTDRPEQAAWLRPDQRTWLAERLAAEQAQREAVHRYSLAGAFTSPKVWMLTIADFGQNMSGFGIVVFLPMIIKGLGTSIGMIGLVAAVPYLFAVPTMLLWAWHSDYTGERTWHVASAFLLCSVGLAVCVFIGPTQPVLLMAAVVLAVIGQQTAGALFWSLPTALLTGTAAAGGIGMINAISNLGGLFGPWTFGLVKDYSGSDSVALFSLAVMPALSVILLVIVGHDRRTEHIPQRS